jgi:hypothetical protein
MHKQSIDEAEDSVDVLHVLLGACARQLVADDDAQAFSDWFVEAVRLRAGVDRAGGEPDNSRACWRARSQRTPLPSSVCAAPPAAPGREKCFAARAGSTSTANDWIRQRVSNINMLRYVLDARQWPVSPSCLAA